MFIQFLVKSLTCGRLKTVDRGANSLERTTALFELIG